MRRAHCEIIEGVGDVLRSCEDDVALDPELALTGATRIPTTPVSTRVPGLKERPMVGAEGLEPPASAV